MMVCFVKAFEEHFTDQRRERKDGSGWKGPDDEHEWFRLRTLGCCKIATDHKTKGEAHVLELIKRLLKTLETRFGHRRWRDGTDQ